MAFVRRSSAWWMVFLIAAAGCSGGTGQAEKSNSEKKDKAAASSQSEKKPVDGQQPTEGDSASKESDEAEGSVRISKDSEEIEDSKAAPTLSIGDPAPELKVAEWVHGEPVDGLNEGQVYVVEFWATWCRPCRASMPHISELQTKYLDDVRFVGVSDEDTETVTKFLEKDFDDEKKWKEVVTYALALDEKEQTTRSYMRAAGQAGIPTAFIVGRDRNVQWIGHPMSIDEPLEKIVRGDWDLAAARAEFEREKKINEDVERAMRAVRIAEQTNNPSKAVEALERLSSEYPDREDFVFIYLNVLNRFKMPDEALALVESVKPKHEDDAEYLATLAWILSQGDDDRLWDQALALATTANELSKTPDGIILEVIARVHANRGDFEKAIEWQEKSVEASGTGSERAEHVLAMYKAQRQAQIDESKATEGSDAESESPTSGDATEGAKDPGIASEAESDGGSSEPEAPNGEARGEESKEAAGEPNTP